MRTMGAARFKAHCLAVLDEVETRREPILVTKNGKPVAKMIPLDLTDETDPLDRFNYPGLKVVGDLEAPLYTDAEWEGFSDAAAVQH